MKKFLRCEHCGNMVGVLNDSGVPMICCGEPMKELVPNTTDAANEKHVPVVTVEGDVLKAVVGSVEHPMEEAHYIQFIFVETDKGGHRRALKPGEKPEAEFNLHGEKPVAVYEYCNLHGLWKKEL
ncbi:MAG TPA: desulfoferrodoxin [Candidatus Eubacterium pullicola]|uniref:Desulfoferrodoxin n=1 Tax=Gallibacter intestinalis TaxID=2779356 RepID=A0ABR9QW99_9FIRM|nr:desulfoferrodoxin family protein [Gallibacter intestinalis]MBE5035146.1 desulfoferrodoxin [Gallibacter intestinalis]HIW40110.1 desulfoferrodoxin [Candidatus Eubacterium pullicola]